VRGDVQEPDLRCGTPGTSGHVTIKSSIRNWGVLYKSGVYALKALCLTPGGLLCVSHSAGLRIEQSILTAWEKSAEGILGGLKQASNFGSMDELGTRPVIERAGVGNSRPNRTKIDVMPLLKARTV